MTSIVNITFSEETKNLIAELQVNPEFPEPLPEFLLTEWVDALAMLEWLIKQSDKNLMTHYQGEVLLAALLKDLSQYLALESTKDNPKSQKNNSPARWRLIAFAAIIFFGSEGFDGISAVLGLFSIPALVTFFMGLLFSIFSLVVCSGIDLFALAKNLGIKRQETPQWIDAYVNQWQEVKAIYMAIRDDFVEKNKETLLIYKQLLTCLQKKMNDFQNIRLLIQNSLNKPIIRTIRTITAITAGIFFFSAGYFSGQTVALFLASVFVANISALAWPIVVASILVGICGIIICLNMEYSGIENVVNGWFGLDKEKIEQFYTEEEQEKYSADFTRIIRQIDYQVTLLEKAEQQPEPEKQSIKEYTNLLVFSSNSPKAVSLSLEEVIEKQSEVYTTTLVSPQDGLRLA